MGKIEGHVARVEKEELSVPCTPARGPRPLQKNPSTYSTSARFSTRQLPLNPRYFMLLLRFRVDDGRPEPRKHFSKQKCLVDARGWRGMNGLVSDVRMATATQMSTRYKQGALKSFPEHRTLKLTRQQSIMAGAATVSSVELMLQFTLNDQNWATEEHVLV